MAIRAGEVAATPVTARGVVGASGEMTMTGRFRVRGWQVACLALLFLLTGPLTALADEQLVVQEYPVAAGTRPHDAVPDRYGRAGYVGEGDGTAGRLEPGAGETVVVRRGEGAAPHGIIMGPDGAAWITDGGLNAIVRVD